MYMGSRGGDSCGVLDDAIGVSMVTDNWTTCKDKEPSDGCK